MISFSGQEHCSIGTGVKNLDEKIGKIYQSLMINEIYGVSGSGKTQFLLTIIAYYLKQNTKKIVIYYKTNGIFPIDRLIEILNYEILYLDHILIKKSRTAEDLINSLDWILNCLEKEDDLLRTNVKLKNIGIIVIDNIASILRNENNGSKKFSNKKAMFLIVYKCKQISLLLNCIIFCENEVTFDNQPALGLNWRSLIDTSTRLHENKIIFEHNTMISVKEFEYTITNNGFFCQ